MTVAKRKSSIDDKTEANRKIIRRSLDEIKAQVEYALRDANISSPVHIVVPSRYSLITIAGPCDASSDERSRLSSIVCEVIGQKLGREGLRGRPLACAMATAKLSAADVATD